MKIDQQEIQVNVNETRDRIIDNTRIWVEPIRVFEKEFKGMLRTRPGLMFYNPRIVSLYADQLEYAIHHELAHRLHERMDCGARSFNVYTILDSFVQDSIEDLSEGMADCLSMDFFPSFLDVEPITKEVIEKRRKRLQEITRDENHPRVFEANEYCLARRVYQKSGFEGLLEYCAERRKRIEQEIRELMFK